MYTPYLERCIESSLYLVYMDCAVQMCSCRKLMSEGRHTCLIRGWQPSQWYHQQQWWHPDETGRGGVEQGQAEAATEAAAAEWAESRQPRLDTIPKGGSSDGESQDRTDRQGRFQVWFPEPDEKVDIQLPHFMYTPYLERCIESSLYLVYMDCAVQTHSCLKLMLI